MICEPKLSISDSDILIGVLVILLMFVLIGTASLEKILGTEISNTNNTDEYLQFDVSGKQGGGKHSTISNNSYVNNSEY
jgi:hypothetical protein